MPKHSRDLICSHYCPPLAQFHTKAGGKPGFPSPDHLCSQLPDRTLRGRGRNVSVTNAPTLKIDFSPCPMVCRVPARPKALHACKTMWCASTPKSGSCSPPDTPQSLPNYCAPGGRREKFSLRTFSFPFRFKSVGNFETLFFLLQWVSASFSSGRLVFKDSGMERRPKRACPRAMVVFCASTLLRMFAAIPANGDHGAQLFASNGWFRIVLSMRSGRLP